MIRKRVVKARSEFGNKSVVGEKIGLDKILKDDGVDRIVRDRLVKEDEEEEAKREERVGRIREELNELEDAGEIVIRKEVADRGEEEKEKRRRSSEEKREIKIIEGMKVEIMKRGEAIKVEKADRGIEVKKKFWLLKRRMTEEELVEWERKQAYIKLKADRVRDELKKLESDWNTSDWRKVLCRQFCRHLEEGKSTSSFPVCEYKEIGRMIREYPEDFDIVLIDKARRLWLSVREKRMEDMVEGKLKGNPLILMFTMKNRYSTLYKDRVENSVNLNVTQEKLKEMKDDELYEYLE